MVVALILLLANATTVQICVEFVYHLMGAGNGTYTPTSNFLSESQKGLRGFGIASLFSYIGIWIIKLNFLLFFYRLGIQITQYIVFWWIVFVVTIACGAASIGIMQFSCLFGPIIEIMTTCNLPSSMSQTYNLFKISCILDVVSDALSKSCRVQNRNEGNC